MQTDIHAPGGLRILSPSGREAEIYKQLGLCGQSVPFKQNTHASYLKYLKGQTEISSLNLVTTK